MASTPSVLMLTEQFDPARVDWFLNDATVDDLALPGGGYLIGKDSNFAKVQGIGGSHFNIHSALSILKSQVANWKKFGGKVHYRYSSNFADVEGGRLMASTGYQNWPNFLRGTFASSKYWMWDFVNCQPVLIKHVADSHGWPCPRLTEYVGDRAHYLDSFPGLPRDESKKLILAVLYGCSASRIEGRGEWLAALHAEVKAIQDAIWAEPRCVFTWNDAPFSCHSPPCTSWASSSSCSVCAPRRQTSALPACVCHT